MIFYEREGNIKYFQPLHSPKIKKHNCYRIVLIILIYQVINESCYNYE